METIVRKTFEQLTVDELYDILALRTNIFVVEQQCPYPELDGKDQLAIHYWMRDDEGITAYLRVLVAQEPTAIGRVVTRETARGKGLSRELMNRAIEEHGHETLYVQAQTYVEPFYASLGFERSGETYLEDDIPHCDMYRAPRS